MRKSLPNRLLSVGIALVALCIPLNLQAHSPIGKDQGNDLGEMAERSNLVMLGQVMRVEYKNVPSEEKSEGTIPHTFATYRVERVLRGQAPGPEITLRFVGGPDGRGGFLTVNGVPIIQEGDRDVLFVNDPGDPSCPLVHCENGRFRVLAEKVYDTHGAPVKGVSNKKALSRGKSPEAFQKVRFPVPAFDELIKNPAVEQQLKSRGISVDEARRRYETEGPKEIVLASIPALARTAQDQGQGTQPTLPGPDAVPLPLAQFISATENIARSARRSPMAVKGADNRSPVAAARLSVVAAKTPPAPAAISHATKEDENEFNALKANNFNPVVRKNP